MHLLGKWFGHLSRGIRFAVWVISGEFLLTWPHRRANGGTIILTRALIVSALLYVFAIGLDESLNPNSTLQFSGERLRLAVKNTLPWFGGIFTVVYAALYARFSSQWTYLAGVYNQIKAAEARLVPSEAESHEAIVAWKAAFVEDADELHLAVKPMYAALIKAWCENDHVRAEFAKTAPGGGLRLAELLEEIDGALARHAKRFAAKTAPRVLP